MAKSKQKKEDGRKNNKGVTKPPEERKVSLSFQVKSKNKEVIKEKLSPIVKRLDK